MNDFFRFALAWLAAASVLSLCVFLGYQLALSLPRCGA